MSFVLITYIFGLMYELQEAQIECWFGEDQDEAFCENFIRCCWEWANEELELGTWDAIEVRPVGVLSKDMRFVK